MNRLTIMLAAVLVGCSTASAPAPFAMSLDDAKVGQLPPGWTAAKTGQGSGSVWKVLEDPTAPGGKKVLAQTSDQGQGDGSSTSASPTTPATRTWT